MRLLIVLLTLLFGPFLFAANPPYIGKTLLVGTNGNDAASTRAIPMFRSPLVAASNALSGDTIIVYPGLYSVNTNILKNGVNWILNNGATLACQYASNNFGYTPGLFDDRGIGAVTSTIGGFGAITFIGDHYSNSTCLGAIVITNPASDVSFRLKSIDCAVADNPQSVGAVTVLNCTNFVMDVDYLIDSHQALTVGWAPGDFPEDPPVALVSLCYAFYIENGGRVNVRSKWVRPDWRQSDIYFYISNTANLNLDISCERIGLGGENSTNSAVPTVSYCHAEQGFKFMTCTTNCTSRINAGQMPRYTVSASTGAKHYLTAQSTDRLAFDAAALEFHGQIEKLYGDCALGGGVNLNSGNPIVYLDVLENRDVGDGDPPIYVKAGTLHYRGIETIASQTPYGTPGSTEVVRIDGGTAYLEGRFRGAATNPVVVVTGGNLYFQHAVLIANAGFPAITAASGKTVGILSSTSSSKTNHPNITLSPNAGFTIDANVK